MRLREDRGENHIEVTISGAVFMAHGREIVHWCEANYPIRSGKRYWWRADELINRPDQRARFFFRVQKDATSFLNRWGR